MGQSMGPVDSMGQFMGHLCPTLSELPLPQSPLAWRVTSGKAGSVEWCSHPSRVIRVTSGLALNKMAAPIRVRQNPEVPGSVRVQLLPCSVRFDGAAPVKAFMRERNGPDGELWASFRGRRLGGRERLLPHGYRGGVLQRSPTHGSDGDTQEVTLTATFDSITEWGADNVPPPLGGLANALQWGQLAQAIHSSIPVNDSEEAEP